VHLLVDEARAPLTGRIDVPRSKYHAHRALILASLAPGRTRITGASGARHVGSTIEVLRALGTEIELDAGGFTVHGGPYRPYRPSASVGSSGSTLYFMIGLAALADRPFTLTGQKYFQRRPVGALLEALTRLGVELHADEDRPPITVRPSRPAGGHVKIAGTLSQWISGLLLVAPFGTGRTVVEVEGTLNEQPYIELTVRMMRQFGLHVDVADDWRRFEIEPGQEAQPTEIELPPDIGSAAFGLAATALHPSDVVFQGLRQTRAEAVDHPEAHFLDVVARMGLPMEVEDGAVRVRHDGIVLRGTGIDCRPMPDMLPILATLGAFAQGETTFDNVGHVRLKESDRVVAMMQLNRMGGSVTLDGDQLVVRGVEGLEGAPLSSFNDHRVLMSLAVAGSRAHGQTSLTYANAYRISYPTFVEDLNGIGLSLNVDRRNGTSRRRPSVAIDQASEIPLSEWVRRWAGERPTATAIVDVRSDGTRAWSWRALDEAADRAASLLLELGVQPGERVAYQLPNWGEFVVLTLGILRIGAVCCPLMPIFRRRELEFMLDRSQARVMVVPERFRGREHAAELHELLTHVPGLALEHALVLRPDMTAVALPDHDGVQWHDYAAALRRQVVDADAIAARLPEPTATAQLLFTSGTTGEPKGVLHRNDALSRAAFMEVEHLGLGRDDRLFIPSPLAHQTGFLYGMWNALVLGAGQILQDTWDPQLAAQALREWGGSFVQAATPFLSDLVRVVEEGEPGPSALRIFVVTGAAVPRALAERATAVLDTAVCGAWGSTESCLGTLAAPTDPLDKRWGTDGRALPGTAIRVVDDAGTSLPPGVEGHFEVRSETLFEGYLERPDLTANALTADGWYRSGDLATIDEDGYLHITGRVTDVVNRGGEKVPVAEIEQLLHRHSAIADVAIVAMPDERLGERACAFVVPAGDEPVDLELVRAYLDEAHVAKQYWPERVELIDALPRNAIGKIQKYVLRDRAGELSAHPA
jgi:3-phosphoshikimate 1-carboxyvinyltransferase